MIKKEGVAAVSLIGLAQYMQDFGKEGGAIAPEFLTQLTQIVPLPILVIAGVVLYIFRSNKEEVLDSGPPIICPYAPKPIKENDNASI